MKIAAATARESRALGRGNGRGWSRAGRAAGLGTGRGKLPREDWASAEARLHASEQREERSDEQQTRPAEEKSKRAGKTPLEETQGRRRRGELRLRGRRGWRARRGGGRRGEEPLGRAPWRPSAWEEREAGGRELGLVQGGRCGRGRR